MPTSATTGRKQGCIPSARAATAAFIDTQPPQIRKNPSPDGHSVASVTNNSRYCEWQVLMGLESRP